MLSGIVRPVRHNARFHVSKCGNTLGGGSEKLLLRFRNISPALALGCYAAPTDGVGLNTASRSTSVLGIPDVVQASAVVGATEVAA